ncbi:hypothetical protein BG015_009685 [Linnemannia schmuckeri]|uniref:WD40 repeat-like protein n=1 Tax=Linnemannia schmuckeri TaxID=64567 RepID=A0A9P5S801_9FUNG|nr:hypothetical protein BG015_009685 [Linnemannia schmuckeri]
MQPEETPNSIRVQVGDRVITSLIHAADRIIVTFDCETVIVYNALTGAVLQTLTGHQGGDWASALYNSNTLITAVTDRTIHVWDLEKGVCTHVFQIHTSTVRTTQIVLPNNINYHGLQLAPKYDSEFPIIVAGSRDTTLSGHTQLIRDVAAEGNLVASASYDTTARILNSHTGELIHTLVGHKDKLYAIVLDSTNRHTLMVGLLRLNDNLLASASADGTVKVWDPITAKPIHTLGNHLPGTG